MSKLQLFLFICSWIWTIEGFFKPTGTRLQSLFSTQRVSSIGKQPLYDNNNDNLPTVNSLAANLKATAAKLRAEAAELEAAEKRLMVEKLSDIFNTFDTNKDGKVSVEELRNGLSKLLSSSVTDEQAKKIMSQFDTSGDGALQPEEFQSIDVFSSKFESILREERRAAQLAEEQAAIAKAEAESAEAIAALINNRPPSAADRFISILPFFLPFLDSIPFGKNLIFNLQLEGSSVIEFIGYLYVVYQKIPFAGLIAFILFSILTNNLKINRLVRYNIQLAIYLDIGLIIPGTISALVEGANKYLGASIPDQVIDGASTATFFVFGVTLLYAIVSSLLGKEPDKLPYINDRIRERVPSTEEFKKMYKNYEELMEKRAKDKKDKDDANRK